MSWMSNTVKIIALVVVVIFFVVAAIYSFKGNKFLKSLKSKLTVAVIVVAVVLVGVLTFVSVKFVNKASVETLANTLMPIANSTASYFDQSVVRLGETLDETLRSNKVTSVHTVSDAIIQIKTVFPSNVIAIFNVTNGRFSVTQVKKASFSRRASCSNKPQTTSTPASRSI